MLRIGEILGLSAMRNRPTKSILLQPQPGEVAGAVVGIVVEKKLRSGSLQRGAAARRDESVCPLMVSR